MANSKSRIRYQLFSGKGKIVFANWFSEFEGIAMANRDFNDPIRVMLLGGLLTGEAHKWYKGLPNITNYEVVFATLKNEFQEPGARARVLEKINQTTHGLNESLRH